MKTHCFTLLLALMIMLSASLRAQQLFNAELSERIVHEELPFNAALLAYDLYEIDNEQLRLLAENKAETLNLEWSFGGDDYVLELSRNDRLFAPGFRVVAGSKNANEEVSYVGGAYYHGKLRGIENSLVAISFFDHKIMGVVSTERLGNVNIGLVETVYSNRKTLAIAYQDAAVIDPPTFSCEIEEPPSEPSGTSASNSLITNTICFSSYLELDHALYLERGGTVTGATDYVTGAFNVVATIYDNEQMTSWISEIFVWTSPDAYPITNSSDALTAFREAMDSGFNGDLAHLISRGSGNNGGRAYIDVICDNFSGFKTAYSNIHSTYADYPNYSWTVKVMTHEIGHNLGSRHTHDCVWNGNNTQIDDCGNVNSDDPNLCFDENNPIIPSVGGTIMSYCQNNSVGINYSEGFGPQPGDLIRSITQGCSNCQDTNCEIPSDIQLTSTGYSHYRFDWDNSTTTTTNIRYRELGMITWIELFDYASGVHISSSKLPCTTYEWQIQGVCNDQTSPWSNSFFAETTGCDDNYCYAYGNTFDYWITGVNITAINNNSGNGYGYENFTNQTAELLGGETYDITLNSATDANNITVFWSVWIDLNRDNDFLDAGEQVLSTTSTSGQAITPSFTMPNDINNGFTRMRVAMSPDGAPNDPCQTGNDLDVEDYTAYIEGSVQEELTVTPEQVFFPAVGGTESITVTANVTWTVSEGATWFSVSPTSGSGNGSFTIDCDQNFGADVRTATITVTGGGITRTIMVEQSATLFLCNIPPSIELTSTGYSHYRFDWDNSTTTTTNIRYRELGTTTWVELFDYASGVHISSSKLPCTTYEWQIQGVCNDQTSPWSNSFFAETTGCDEVYCYGYGNSFDYWITGVNITAINNNSGNGYGYENFTNQTAELLGGETYDITLNSATDENNITVFWSVWIDLNRDNDFLDAGEQVLSTTSTSGQAITPSFTMPNDINNGFTRMRVAMSPDGAPNDPCQTGNDLDVEDYTAYIEGSVQDELTVTPEQVFFPAVGGTESITVTANVTWTVSEGATWFSVSPTSGSGNGSFTIDCEQNFGADVRTATITVTGGGITRTIMVEQSATLFLCNIPPSIELTSTGYSHYRFDWDNSTTETTNIRYRELGTTTWVELFDYANGVHISSSKLPCTTYEWQIQGVCLNGLTSEWSPSFFAETTGCDEVYCYGYGNSFDYWITGVNITDINNNSGNGYGYENFTNQTAELLGGETYDITLNSATDENNITVFWSVWIDLNRDNDFLDAGEQVLSTTSTSGQAITPSFTMPNDINNGFTRMRVAMSPDGAPNDPCQTGNDLDVEDYTAYIEGNVQEELTVTPEQVFFPAVGGTENITVTSNVTWTVSEGATWFSVSPTSGSGNGSFTIDCDQNFGADVRTATITVTGGGITRTVNIEQAAAETILTVNPENIFFAAPGGNQNITISSNVNWTVEENAAWFSVDPESGQGDGIINISCQLNPNLSSRTATITIIGGGIERTITVEQSGAMPFLTATPENVFFTAPGGMEEVMVNSNVSWTVSENSPWFSIDPQSGIDNGSFIIECDANTGTQSRSATITLSGGGITLIITVEQAGTAPMLTVTPSSVFFQEAGGSATIVVSSNVSWTVDENTLWLSVNPLNGAGNGSFTISCQPHTGTQSRTAIITVMGGGVSRTVTVEQAGMTPFLSANPEDLFFPAAGDSEEIMVNSNISWIVSGGDSWLSFSTQNGTGSSSFTVTCEPNPGTEIRTAVITISGNGLTRSIEVGQAGSVPFLDVSQDFVFFNPPGGSEQIELSSNIAWTITSSEPWVSVSPMSGNGDASLFLDCDENTDPDTREAVFTIIGDGINASFTVEQFGTNIFCVDSETNIDTMLCAGQTVVIGENSYTESGTFENLFQTEDGCDSLIILNLEVLTLTGILPTELTTCQGMPANLFAPAGYLISLPGENAVNSLELMPGTYTITLEEQMLGCQSEQMITVLNEGGLSVNISGETSVCNDETSLITASGGLTYEWSGGATPNSAANELSIGDYSLTVTDASGCSVVESISITADQTAPVFTDCPQSQSFQLAAGQNMMPVNWLEPSATDNCGIDGLSISSTHQSGDMFMEGTTTVNYTASDQVGQTSNCSFNITILGATVNDELTFYLDTVGYTRSGDTLCVPVRVLNFVDVAAFQLSLLADDEILSSLDTALAVSPLTGLDGVGGVLFDRVNSQQAQLIWLNGTGQGLTLADGSAILTVKMLVDNPPPGSCIPLAITDDPLFVEAFVVGEGSIVPQIINGSICLAGEYAISGEIYRIDDEPINLAEVSLLGNDTTEVDTTDVAGRYGFADVLGGSEYILRPARDFGDAEGLSVLDMITILRHVQGQTLIDDPYLLLAADVNQSQSISTADILEIRELVLGNLIAFGNHTSWFFLPVDYSFPNPTNPWQEAVPHEVIFPSLDADTVVDFYGLKIGDVNLSNIGQNLISNTFILSYVDQAYSPGQLLEVAVYASDFTDLSGFQLALSSGELEILDMVPGAATVAAGSLVSRPESWSTGELPLVFLRQQAADNAADSLLFTLQLRAKTTGRLSEQLRMNNGLLSPEAFTNDLSPLNIELSATALTNTASALGNTTALLRVQPNPFRQQFQLDFYLSQATDVHLQLMDVQGRVVYEQSTAAAAGAVSLTLAPKNVLSAGVYFCRWQTEQASGVVRVVKE